jgi:hypothetical protein
MSVVYATERQVMQQKDFRPFPSLLDPSLLRAARQIYRGFYEVHPEVIQRPIGVAINRLNHRGKLIFGKKPVLLPQECFVPFEQIQAELY